jgi:hypothetical protein
MLFAGRAGQIEGWGRVSEIRRLSSGAEGHESDRAGVLRARIFGKTRRLDTRPLSKRTAQFVSLWADCLGETNLP